MKAVRQVNTSNGVPYLKIRLVGSHGTSGREKEVKKGKTEFYLSNAFLL